ncbi:unnamed protein product [Didymodactylos carnosus]|uniref:Uncharacterized protein n=1 Tax=Didymodactylos carnosus TaxID=1234261 RepID=A0A814IKP7_9BILA|nr:unnamed protein product [Didymodactylos carnosus]CAF1057969.1 unnamed protein product [Didymodactylos carnosus]CAF3796889.1 unnamed protein product [Didymodactylos carnosus]CAF3823915.1 unnamed protein product [Didymodactylos carnosus]
MIHTASLIHDDVVDSSDRRRGKKAAATKWGPRKAVLAGDYILGTASVMLARIGNPDVTLNTRESDDEQFQDYLNKTYCKTASLFANSCKAVALLSASQKYADIAFDFGRNFGMAFQLIDDLLDVTSTADVLGKPTTADLKLGLSTAPVLFASQQYPELQSLILRRFSEPDDIEKALYLLDQVMSDGKSRTYQLAEQYANEAIRQLNVLTPTSQFIDLLIHLTKTMLKRCR